MPVGVKLPEGEFVTDPVDESVDDFEAVTTAVPVPVPDAVGVIVCEAVILEVSEMLGVSDRLPPTEILSRAVAVVEGVDDLVEVGVREDVVDGVVVLIPVPVPVRVEVGVSVPVEEMVASALGVVVIEAVTEGDAPIERLAVAEAVTVVDFVFVVEAVLLVVGVAVGVPDDVPVPDIVTVPVRVNDRETEGEVVDVGEDDAVIEGDVPKLSVVVGVTVEVGETVTVEVSDSNTPESMKLGSSPKVGPSTTITF